MPHILAERIMAHEGYRGVVYLDKYGHPHLGWGHHLWIGSPVPLDVSISFLRKDIADASDNFLKLKDSLGIETIRSLNKERRRVITEMLFIMNIPKVLSFKKMWSATKRKKWDEAADEILWNDKNALVKTKFYEDVGTRALFLSEIYRSGEDPPKE